MSTTGVDPYLAWVGFYDEWSATMEGDVAFYVRRATAVPGPVIELGVGTGRIAIPIAEADMRSFVAEAPVNLVTIPYRSFLHMITTEDQLTCLRNVGRSLVSGGHLILNMFVPDPAFIAGQDRKRNLHTEFTDERGRRCEVWVTPVYDMTTQIVTIRATVDAYDGDRLAASTESEMVVRMIYRFEMEHLLARTGFEVEELYGDFDESPLVGGSSEMIWVARKP